MIKEAHASTHAAVSVALTSAPVWVGWLQHINVLLGFVSMIMGLIVGGITIYQFVQSWRRKP